MLQSYVGIVSRYGLELLCPEHEHTAQFVSRRAARQRHRKAMCFWAVIESTFAEQILIELAEGNRADALMLLHTFASELGAIIPAHPADVVSRRK